MPWKIAHAEQEEDGTVHVTKLVWLDAGKVTETYPLPTAIVLPPPGPGYGPAIAAMRLTINALRNPPAPPDFTDIDDLLNTGGG